MEKNQLEASESIALISRMIENTRNRMERHAGRPFLIWGYVTILVSLFEYFCALKGMNPAWGWAWLAIPAIGLPLTCYYSRREKQQVRTYIDQVITAVWIVFGISAFLAPLIASSYPGLVLMLVVLLMGMGTAVTGLVIRFRPVTAAGFAAMGASLLFLWFRVHPEHATAEPLLFAAIFLGMMVIPGHILNYRSNRAASCSKS